MKVSDVILNEWSEIWKDKRLLAVLFIIPLAYMLIFGFMYEQGQVQELSTIYIDESNTQASQQVLQAFDNASAFQLVGETNSEQELRNKIQTGEAEIGIIIPQDFADQLKKNRGTDVLVFVDGSNMMVANAATRSANEIVATFSGGISIKRLEAAGIHNGGTAPIQYGYRILYNPGFSYGIFLLPGLLGTVVQQIIFLGVALSVTREKEFGRWNQHYPLFLRPWRLLYAKMLPYLFIGCFNIVMMWLIISQVFSVPFLGSFYDIAILSFAFVCSLLGIGFLASLTAKTQLAATQVTMLIALPSFLLSGFTWPFAAMPDWIAAIGHCLPLTYFLHGVREIAIKGNGLAQVTGDIQILFLMAVVSSIVAFIILYIQGRKLYSCQAKQE